MIENDEGRRDSRAFYRFGDFELRTHPAALRRGDADTALPSQPLRLLLLLVERRGEIVTHDDIRELLWPDQNVDITSRLHSCIRQVRRALGDDNGEPRCIETVPRRGYRFVADVEVQTPPRREDLVASKPARGKRTLFVAVALILVAIVWFGASRQTDTPSVGADTSSAGSSDAFLQGRALLATGDAADLQRAVESLTLAAESNPDFAPVQASLSKAWFLLGDGDKSREHAERAIALDATYANGYLRRARVTGWIDWNWDAAERDLETALGLTPDAPEPHLAIAELYMVTGRVDAAAAATGEALRVAPSSAPVLAATGELRHLQRRHDEAASLCEQAVVRDPDLLAGRECLYRIALVGKDYSGALEQASEITPLLGADRESVTSFDGPDAESALMQFERWRLTRNGRDLASTDPVLAAYSNVVLRQYDEALYLLHRARDQRSPSLPLAMLDLVFVGLFHQTAYAELSAEVGVVVL